MHFGNGQAEALRKDGASPPVLGLRICPLFLLAAGLLLGLGSGTSAGWCQPCPGNCTCANDSCLVNCSGGGLQELEAVPANVTVLDISNNNIETLDQELFEQLQNLTEINLSDNPWSCDCRLSWLPRWAAKSGISVVQADSTVCDRPYVASGQQLFNVSFSKSLCGSDLIYCPSSPSTDNESVSIFVPISLTHASNETCSAQCYAELYNFWALDSKHGCLCGDVLPSNASFRCREVCDTPSLLLGCGLTIIQDVLRTESFSSLHASSDVYRLGESVHLQVEAPVPVTPLLWDLGSQVFSTSEVSITHRYAQPGVYNVTVTLKFGSRDLLLHEELRVVGIPEEVKLLCPSLVRTNETVDVHVVTIGGTDVEVQYTVTSQDDMPVSPVCPLGSVVYPNNNHCYQLISEKAGWFEAQKTCQEWGNGDMAVVSSLELQSFLKAHVTSGLEVWIGFNDSRSSESLPAGKRFDLESCQNWLPGQPEPSQADRCVRMGPNGVCNTDLCSATHNYVCEYKPQAVSLNAEYFVVGSLVFDTNWPLQNLTRVESVSSSIGEVEVLVFPSLRFSQEVYISALEFVTEEVLEPVQMRFQVYTQSTEHDCPSQSTSSPPSSLPIKESLPDCEEEPDSSNYTNSTLPVESGCFPSSESKDAPSSLMAPSNKSLPNLTLLKEYLFTIPAGNATQYLATFEDASVQMLPNYLIVLQHDAPNKKFLHCHSSRSYHVIYQSDWVTCIPGHFLGEALINGTSETSLGQQELYDGGLSCSLRVVGTTKEVASVFSDQLNPGLWQPGKYTITANFTNQLYKATQYYSFSVVSPVSGLSVIYPTPENKVYYIPSDDPVVILKILSGSDSTAFWAGSNQTWSFSRTCPPKISAVPTECTMDKGDISYSEVNLLGLGRGAVEVLITVQNEISSQNITCLVKMEDPIRGLSASPSPQARVLLNTRVNNVASVEAGSDVIFKWTVDDRPSFTFYNTVFNVIYQSAAMYKLALTASNHVSNASVNYNVTVEKMNPMRDLKISGIPAIVTQYDSLLLSASIIIDSAVDVIFLWLFGDGTQLDYNVRPPYNQSFSVPDPAIHMVLVENSVTHTYQETGSYNVSLLVFNKYENMSKLISLQVQSILTNITIETDAEVLVSGRMVSFRAAAEPSSFGVIYSWDLGDGTYYHNNSEPVVNHTYNNPGSFNVSIWASNDISEITVVQTFYVYEEITGLVVESDEPTERGMQTLINASVKSGDAIIWRFDMGDGYILEGNEPMVNYTYSKDGNYTVNVTARNLVNFLSEILQVRVYVLQILKIEPSICILENSNVTLTAHVTGDYQTYTFNWTFDNGSSIITVYGVPSVQYDSSKSGIFPLSLILSSQVNKAYYYTNICIEPEIVNVTLLPALQNVSLGNESLFKVIVFPHYQYRYNWDFGTNGSKYNGGTEVSFVYKVPGVYQVTVSVFNNVSFHNGTAIVDVQEPIGALNIKHNGSEILALDEVYLFEALGDGTKVEHHWDFGDGFTDQRQSVGHAYNRTGTFTINLYGYNSVSCNRTHLNVTVKTKIQGLTMNATRTIVPLNGSVTFSAFLQAGDNVRYSWILCDRCSAIFCNSTISYTFRSIGTFNVIVTAENELGSLQDSIIIYVLEIIEGLQIITGDLVNDCCFPTNKSLPLQATVKDGTNISYSWFILKNDSVVQTGAGRTYQFISLQPEYYTIVLKAVNMLGNASVSMSVVFVESLGQVQLSAHPNPVAVNTTVNISMSLSSGSGVMYTWHLEESVVWFTYESFVLYNFLNPNTKEVLAIANNTLGLVNSAITIFVQEPVEGLSITSLYHKSDYVPTGTLVYLFGSVQRGTNVSWIWSIGHQEGRSANVLFDKSGFYTVSLNASNDVSWEIAYKNVTVQDRICGLKLLVSKMVVEPGERVTFNVIMSAGTDVTYKLTINGDFSILLNGTSYTHNFTKIGGYPVTVVAHNQVSEERDTVMISVLEAIENLKIVNCCERALPARIEKSFRAEVSNGSLVAYTWQFDLQGYPPTSLAGRNVTYTPLAAGVLRVYLSASNALGSQNISKEIKIQELIINVTLVPVKTFVNRSATFTAVVVPCPRDVQFEWTFGDIDYTLVTNVSTAKHIYLTPGDFLVKVNASNQISFWIAEMTVSTRILECEEPEVQLELPTQVIMRRSQRNYIEAEINLRGCISYKTEHLWEIYKASSCLSYHESDKVHLLNVDMSRPQLVLPKLALDIGNYCFVFSVSFGDTPLSRSSFANVTMSPSRLVPIIDGGSYRVWSSSRDLILDGKKSYDPNLEEDEQTPLTYKWSCTTLTKNLENTVCNSEVMSELGEVSIHKSKLHPDVEYTFFLTISKAERHAESTNQTVLIKKGKVPIVSLKCVSCKAQSVYEVSASSYVYLEGSCTNCHDDSRTGRWTAQSFRNKTLVLNSTTTTTGNREMNLVLRQGVLKDGEGYTFTLHVSDPTMEEEGYASIDLLPNSPPFGGTCRISPNETIHALTTLVHFNCTGWRDTEDEVALVFILRAKRCWAGHCDDFWVYKGSRSEHSTFIPVGYHGTNFVVELSILVQDQQGAIAVALNQSLVISMPKVPEGFQSLGLWLHNLTDTTLQGLLKQGDPQYVAQYSLALITVLNEYEQAVNKDEEISKQNLGKVRIKITDALISLKVNTVDDIRQIAAALAQCTVASKELACTPYQPKTLSKLEAMMSILQNETTQGMMTPTTIADNILNITGDVIQLVNTKSSVQIGGMLCDAPNNVTVASEAYNLSSDLMRIMMKSRVLNEEPLTLQGGEILARGKRSDPLNLLCYSNRTGCQFFIPQGFNSTFPDLTDIIQVMIQVDSNPYPFGFISNYNVSTKVASMEFQTSNGSQIPLESLDSEKAITVIVANNTGVSNITAGVATVESRRSMKVDIEAESSNEHAGLHIQITYKVLDEWYNHMEHEPYISAYLHETDHPNQYNYSAMKQITLDAMKGDDHKLYTFFITPKEGNLTRHYYLNITNHYMWSSVEVTVGMYTSLCQYFDGNERKWKTEGVTPLEDTRSDQAVCLTQHLTAFGASLFVPPHSVNFIYPPPPPGINYIVLLTCAVCFVTYSVATIIVHKLDLLDVSKAGVIPFCGKAGVYKYEVLVKTGWGRGSGTTAHVGISLYGVDNKSGHRHLDGENTFRRNSVDIFQIATEKSLGNVWKIRLWHDNKGLSPSWYIQHVIIRDLQSSKNFFFLVNDWLSVGQEDSGRRVEKEIFAASETELKRFSRIFMAELQRGISEKHVWLSMWDRPPRSRFTRVQRATCCAVLIFLFLCANAVWYGVVGDRNHGDGAVSQVVPFSVDSVAAGLVTSILVYPIYLFILFLFRRARSKTCVRPSLTYFDQNSLEIDSYLDNMMMESSFMTYTGINGEGFSDQTKTEIIVDDTKGFIQWSANDGMLSWPDLLSDPTIMGNSIQKLEKHRNSQNLGLDGSSHPSEEDNVVLGLPSSIPRHFLASDGASSMSLPPELRRISRTETDLLSDLSNPFADKTETIMLDRLNEKGQTLTGPPREVTKSIKSNRTVITDAFQRRGTMLPSWCTRVAHVLSCFLLFCCFGVSVWIGVGFTSSVGLMWLISGIFSFLFSFFVLEPLKVLSEALYFALVVKRLHPEEEDTLVECPLVEHVSERVTKVRPPQGFALFQAREEARKVKLLHRMLKNLVVYMLFFLVVLLTNYGDASVNSSAYLLQRSVRQELASQRFLQIRRSEDFWAWASDVLLPYLGNIQRGSYSNLLGSARLRQIRLKKAACRHGACPEEIEVFDEASYDVSWLSSSFASSQTWLHSPPDNTGAWYWGYMSFYDSSGYIQQLGASLEENEAIIGKLQQDHWIDNLTRALFVEFSLYSPGVELYSSATFLLEFPMAGRTLPSTDVRAFPLLRLSSGPHLLLVMMVFLMMFVVYFVLSECLVIRKEGRQYFTHFWNYIQWLMTVLSVCTVVVDLSRGSLADEQWDWYLKDRAAFLSLHQVAFLSSTFHSLSASVLFILTIKAAQQLRFIREWSMFGKTLSLSMRELCAAAGAVLGLLLIYAQLGFLLFSSSWESFHNFGSSVLSLFSVARGAFSLKIPFPYSSCIHRLYFVSYQVLELWILVKFFAAILVKNYRQVRLDMFRPAFELQDYEMVELFLRRLRIWMGVSKVKEFRHKVRFEGMEPLPSRASSDTKSLRGSTPSAASDTSSSSSFSTISSQLDTLSAMSTRERAEVDANMQRLLPVLETLLSQFDVVNSATEEVYQIERSLEEVRGRVAKRRKHAKASTQKILYTTEVSTGLNRSFTTTQSRSSKSEPYPRVSKNSLAPRPSTVSQALENSSASKGITVDKVVTEEPALIPMQLSHSSQTKRRKSMRAHNRVHPSVS